MSYDISLTDPNTGNTMELTETHDLRGGTYQVGGTRRAWLNVTYNYSPHFYRTLGAGGIREIYGMTGENSLVLLDRAIGMLADDVTDDYWQPTEGNARAALMDLRTLAERCPDGIWQGD